MGKYTRNCGSDNLGAVMESEIENSGSAKRRKISNGELRLCSSKSTRFTGFESDDVSGDQPASCCSSNGSITPNVNCVDLEVCVCMKFLFIYLFYYLAWDALNCSII